MSIVDKKRFKDGHYIGLPANFDDLFVQTRVKLLRKIEGFTGKSLHLADVGCGNGNTVFLLASDFAELTGIDLFPENAEVFKETAIKRNAPNCSIVIKNIETEAVDKQYDRLICFETIEHFRHEDTVKVLYEMLKTGGMLAVTVPHKWWIFETHGAKLPLLPWNRVPFFSWLPQRIHEKYSNARIYTRKRIVRLLEKQGFTIIHTSLITAPLDVMKDSAVKRFLKKYIFRGDTTINPLLATNVFVVAAK